MKKIKELWMREQLWEKSEQGLQFERKFINGMIYFLFGFGFLIALSMIISGLHG